MSAVKAVLAWMPCSAFVALGFDQASVPLVAVDVDRFVSGGNIVLNNPT
jgi:hypothetical protein